MSDQSRSTLGTFLEEGRLILGYGARVWRLIPTRHKFALGGAALLMAAVSACNTALPLLLGDLVDQVRKAVGAEPVGLFPRAAATYLLLIAATYLLRELLQVARRYLVENTSTRIEKAVTVRLVGHLMKMELGVLTQEKVGALQGRIGRSVVGLVRFIRLAFLDFFPPLLTGAFALAAALTRQPALAVVMAGVVPISLYLTMRQLLSQKGVRLRLIRTREELDGTVVELLGGLDYVRAANTQDLELQRVSKAAEARRKLERGHHWKMSLFGCGKALNEGLFHVIVLALAIYLAAQGSISMGDILTFSMLFLNVMAPLNEVHRGLDEGHECSLQVADLMALLDQRPDPSFSPVQVEAPRAEPGEPLLEARGLTVEYATPDGLKKALDGVDLSIRHGETIG